MATAKPKALDRAGILAKGTPELERREVEMPEWQGSVWCRAFTGGDTDYIQQIMETKKLPNGQPARYPVRAYILIRGVVDEAGERIFKLEDAEFLTLQPVALTNRLISALTDLNGGEALAPELEKNFDSDQAEDSPSR